MAAKVKLVINNDGNPPGYSSTPALAQMKQARRRRDEIDKEIDRAFEDCNDNDGKKKKSGRGRSAIVHNERLPYPKVMFRNKLNTAMSNISHIVHQTGCNAIVILNDEKDVDTYISPQWRGSYRDHPEAYGTVIHMAKGYEDQPMEANPMEATSYSLHVPYTSANIVGNVRNAAGEKEKFVKRKMDTYMSQQISDIPLSAPHAMGGDVDDDGDVLGGIRKKLVTKQKKRGKEEKRQEKALQMKKEIASLFEGANLFNMGAKNASKRAIDG